MAAQFRVSFEESGSAEIRTLGMARVNNLFPLLINTPPPPPNYK